MSENVGLRPQKLPRFRFWVILASLVFPITSLIAGQAPRKPTPEERETWRKTLAKTARAKKGCFVAAYPETKWRETSCRKPPAKPYPRRGARPDTVGNGTDFSAQVSGHITTADGSFDSVSGVTSIDSTSSGGASPFSLQVNTNTFSTSACSGAASPSSCQGWEQFVFSDSGSLFIQYWLLNYAKTCPSGWNTFGSDCWINSSQGTSVPVQSASSLSGLKLSGFAASGSSEDSATLLAGDTLYSVEGDNHFTDLTNGWNTAEFNVFGDCCGSQANFNSGSTVVVRTSVDSGTSSGPSCIDEGFTGETNNLTTVDPPPSAKTGSLPALVFTETNAGNPAQAACAAATSIGDTHLKTFDGLMYDFQASGDFVLAKAGDFVVHTRQASAAPLYPNADFNKAVATQMGNTRVAIYIQPTRVLIDGRPNDLGDGKTVLLPTGVQVSRRGNVYTVKDTHGDAVRAVLNSAWIDVTVALSHAPHATAQGLLGNPGGNARELALADGKVLREPVSFNDLYHGYADSWRVKANESLFVADPTVKPGAPEKPFFAEHLTPQENAKARATCTAAGVKAPEQLEACILDTAVFKDESAAKVFVNAKPVLHVIKPAVR